MTTTYLFSLTAGSHMIQLTLQKDRPYGLEDKWDRTGGENCIIVSDGLVVRKPGHLLCNSDGQPVVDLIGAAWESGPGAEGTAKVANKPGGPRHYPRGLPRKQTAHQLKR